MSALPPNAVVIARYGLPIDPFVVQNMPQSMRDDLAAYEGEDGCVVEVTLNHERGVMEYVVWRPGKCDECSEGCSPCALG